jgi:hypothetical protein
VTRAFYALGRPQQSAFRLAVAAVRDSHPGITPQEVAFASLEIERPAIERTHTLCLYDRVEDLLALTPKADRSLIEDALFGGARPCP